MREPSAELINAIEAQALVVCTKHNVEMADVDLLNRVLLISGFSKCPYLTDVLRAAAECIDVTRALGDTDGKVN
jgi:hypothetical protein